MPSMPAPPATRAPRLLTIIVGFLLAVGLIGCGQVSVSEFPSSNPALCAVQRTVGGLDALLLEVESLDPEAVAVEGSPEQVAALEQLDRLDEALAAAAAALAAMPVSDGAEIRDALAGLVDAVQELSTSLRAAILAGDVAAIQTATERANAARQTTGAILATIATVPGIDCPEPSPSASIEPTAEPTPEPTAEPTPEPTAEPTPEPTPEPTAEPTPEPTPTPAPTATETPEPTETPAATETPEPTATPAATASPTPTQSATPTSTPTPTPSPTPEPTPSPTPSPTPTATPAPLPTQSVDPDETPAGLSTLSIIGLLVLFLGAFAALAAYLWSWYKRRTVEP